MLERTRRPLLLTIALSAFYLLGIGWGLPGAERADRVLAPDQRQESFYRALEANRAALYARIGLNPMANYGRWASSGADPRRDPQYAFSGGFVPPGAIRAYPAGSKVPPILMHSYSSFLLRSVDGDEHAVINSLSRFHPRRLDFNPHSFQYGGPYLYPLAGFLAAAHAAGALRLVPEALYYYAHPGELARIYVAGRIFSFLGVLVCLWAMVLIGRRLGDEAGGLWAALFFGLAPGVVALAHIMKPHAWAAAWGLLCLHACLRCAESPGRGRMALAAVFAGVAVGTARYNWVLAFPCAIAFFKGSGSSPRDPRAWARLLGWGAVAGAVFFAANPYAIPDWGDFVAESRGFSHWYAPTPRPWLWAAGFADALISGLGPVLGLLGLGGFFMAARGSREDRLLFFLALPVLLLKGVMFATHRADPGNYRAYLLEMGLAALWAVRWLREAIAGASRRRAALAALALLLAGEAVLYDANFLADRPGRSNAFAAGDWAAKNIPRAAGLGFATMLPLVDQFPPLRFSEYELVSVTKPLAELDAGEASRLPPYFICRGGGCPPGIARYYEALKAFDRGPALWPSFRDPVTAANFPIEILRRKS